ncbi:MAG: uroporphyrinogen decarboxylase [Flavobacteriaceae bacterium]|nr:uroporphyrinogen decarboxylase [Bacteroidia bacterium]NNK88380.1 uroporphyrinogen decarboxylase [Flavobacteriaceae bacterium]
MIETNSAVTEWVGYTAMLMVLVSFMMKDFRRLRFVNSLGAVLFVVYGFLLQISWPIVITNLAIVGVNCYYLFFRKN